MSHGPHEGTRRVLGDDCEECLGRATTLNGLAQLDEGNLQKLAELAADKKRLGFIVRPSQLGASYADMRAIETLRLMARIVDKSGIEMEVAR